MKQNFKVKLIHLSNTESPHSIFRIPPATFPVLAAATPPEIEISLADEACESIDFDEHVDLVGISVILPFAPKAYAVSKRFRERGVKVVLGGHHVTAMPREAVQHADAIVVGEGDQVWPQLLEDFKNNRLKQVYTGGYVPDLSMLPPPRMDLINPRKYKISNVLTATRGCSYACSYCCIPNTSPRFRTRPISHVVRDMANPNGNLLQKRLFIFWDDNLACDRKYLKELFRAITPLRRVWIAEATISDIASDSEFVALAAKSGCRGIFSGVESFNQEALRGVKKEFNKVGEYKDYIKRLHDHGICISAGMMIGFDEDDRSIFDRTLETAIQLNIDVISLVMVTPYPNTPLFAKLESEGRLLHRDWSLYDGYHAVFVPKQMSPEELEEGWQKVRMEFYRYRSIAKRVWKSGGANWLKIPYNMSNRHTVRMEHKGLARHGFEKSNVVL